MSEESTTEGKPSYPEHERKLPRLRQDQLVRVAVGDRRIHYFMPDTKRRVCGRLKHARNRRIPNEACLGVPMASGACKVHGGKAGRPITSGRYSRKLKAMRRDYMRALSDSAMLDPRPDIALMDVAVGKLVERLEDHDCPSWRVEVKDAFDALQTAIRGNRPGQVAAHLKRLGELVERGVSEDVALKDLIEQVDKRAARALKVVELEARREERVTATELAALFAKILEVLEKRLEAQVFHRILPALRATALGHYLPPIGSAEDVAAKDVLQVPVLEPPAQDDERGPSRNGQRS